MSDWSGGYVTDLEYTFGFYRELAPSLLSYALLMSKTVAPDPSAPMAYCELGCGQGMTVNTLAAANPHIDFHATDFNPGQIAFARRFADQAGLKNIRLYEDSFAEFADRKDLPMFDVITFHGIYSWIRPEYRANIVDIIRRKLKPGGLVYASYNCFPGWAAAAPLRHLIYLHGKTTGGPTSLKVKPALDFVDKVRESGARYFKANPTLPGRLEKLRTQDHHYVAHEYMNDVWEMMYFADVAREMQEAKLEYRGSANVLEYVEPLNLTPAQAELLNGIKDPLLRESTRDYMVNQQFRRDIYVKGRVALNPYEHEQLHRKVRIALTLPAADVKFKVKSNVGEVQLNDKICKPIVAALASGPKTVYEIHAALGGIQVKSADLLQSVMSLIGSGQAHPCLSDDGLERRLESTRSFNAAMLKMSSHFGHVKNLASPYTGSGISVNRLTQQFLLSQSQGKDPLKTVSERMAATGETLIIEGKKLSGDAAKNELKKNYEAFLDKELPFLKQAGIV